MSESQDELSITGVQNLNKLKQEFGNAHNNPQKLSFPICSNADVTSIVVDDKHLMMIRVPEASRTQRPIYINNNALLGTYKRNFSGDYRCTQEEVRHWLEQSGRGRGTHYTLANQDQNRPLTLPSEHNSEGSEHNKQLVEIAEPVRTKSRASKQLVRKIILKLCAEEYLPLRTLAKLLNRKLKLDSIRNHYVNPMLEQNLLERRYSHNPQHSHQAYRTKTRPNAN